MTTPTKLFLAAIVVVVCVGASWFAFSQPPAPPTVEPVGLPIAPVHVPTQTVVAPLPEKTAIGKTTAKDGSIPSDATALIYKAPTDRSLDMQLFDKAVLYMMDVQEADGHIDSNRTGAAQEFRNRNNDIILTSVGAWIMMGSSSAANPNPEAVGRARKAIRWLEAQTQSDGTVGDVDGPGESALAQLLAADAFRLAVSYSTRDSLRQETSRLNSVALRKMGSKNGGFGTRANSDEPSADMIALASFVFKFAGYDGFKFDAVTTENKTDGKTAFPIEDEIIGNLKAGLKRLDSLADKSGAVFAEKSGGPSDWRSTVCGMQGVFMINPSRATVTPALNFVFGDFDKATESYPRVLEHVRWGKNGEGFDALSLWQGSIAVVYMFTEDKYESKTWIGNLRKILVDHQGPDGSWAVAGEDAKRGRAWRTGLNAMTLALIAPPPPPPAPPADDVPPNTQPKAAVPVPGTTGTKRERDQ